MMMTKTSPRALVLVADQINKRKTAGARLFTLTGRKGDTTHFYMIYHFRVCGAPK